MPVSIPFTFTNNAQNADATQVNTNFSTLAAFINTETILRDATVAFTAIPFLPSTAPTDPNHATRKGYVDSFFPVTNTNIAANAIDAGKIVDGSVGSAELATDAVINVKVQDGAIGSTKLAASAVVSGKIASAAIDNVSLFSSTLRPTYTCTSGTRPSAATAGQFLWETDTKRVLVSDGGTWHYVKPVSDTFTIAFAGANRKSGSVSFPYTFSAAPIVVASCQALGGTNAEGVTLNINSVTTLGFTYTAYNTWGTSYTQTITAWYIATENY